MIYRVSNKSDLKEYGVSQPSFKPDQNYKDVIVKKPWGYEYLAFENQFVAIWILHIVRTRQTSMHCHPNKKTALIILSGEATFRHTDGELQLKAMDGVVIEKGAFHSTEASSQIPLTPFSENGIWVMEIESPPLKTDLVRKSDNYGRAGTTYEGKDKMVFEPEKILKFFETEESESIKRNLQGSVFTVTRSGFRDQDTPSPDALVSVIGKMAKDEPKDSVLSVGDLIRYKDFDERTKDENLSNYLLLTIERPTTVVKVSDYILSHLTTLGVKDIFAITGGGAMHLDDSLAKNKDLRYLSMHHEQAAAMAAEGHARITGKLGVAIVTSGPGGTNTITGVCGAWIDSIPTIFLSGQVTSNTLIGKSGLRQFGVQETNISELVAPITKYAVTVTDPKTIRYHLEKACYLATTGRPGPVWLDITLDCQGAFVNINELESFHPKEVQSQEDNPHPDEINRCIDLLKQAKRPVMICGYGIRLAKAENEFMDLVEKLKIPVISSWTSSDLIPSDHPFYVGRSGIIGERAGNFTVQNSDLLLVIGSRMSIPQIGYNFKTFARGAKKIMVDIAEEELRKPSLKLDLPIRADAKKFIKALTQRLEELKVELDTDNWRKRTMGWKSRYPVVLPEYKNNKNAVNSYYFVDVLSQKLGSDAIVVTDMGTAFTCTMQTFKTKKGQRLFTSSGHASMGFGLPGAIGACCGAGLRKTICIAGDGALQMNLQELQTMAHYKLPILLFVINNNGYLTIKLMQQNHFGRLIGAGPESGVTCPNLMKLANALDIKAERIENQAQLDMRIDSVLAQPGPFICEIMMPEDQALIPRVSSLKKADGTIVSKPIEDMYPFLEREEFSENMDIDPVEILKGEDH